MNYTKLFFETINNVLKDHNLSLTYNVSGTRKIDLSNFKYNLDNTPKGFDLIELSGSKVVNFEGMYRYDLTRNGYDSVRAVRYILMKARETIIKHVMSKSNVFKIDNNFYLLTKHQWSDNRQELTRINPINNNAPTDEYRYILTNNNDMELSNHFLCNTDTILDHLDRIIPIYTKPFDITEIDHYKVADADKDAVFVMRVGRTYGKFNLDESELAWFPRCAVSGYLTTALANYFNERVHSVMSPYQKPITFLVDETLLKCADCDARDLSLFDASAKSINIKFRGNSHLCDKCADDVVNKGIDLATYTAGKYNVGGYASNPRTLNFGKFDSESTPLYMGIELEVDTSTRNRDDMDDEEYTDDDQRYDQDNHNYNSNYALHIMSGGKDTIFTKTDGSLNNGFEIVSHPMTLAKHLRTMQWQKGMEFLTKMGYKSHNTSTCGLHIHINRNFFGSKSVQGINGAKIAYLLEKNRNDVVKFTRRRTEELDRWARFGDMARWFNNATPRTKSMLSTAFRSQYSPRNKYVALNTIHAETFEFRIFKGTLNFGTLVASMQFVDNLARIVKDIPNNDNMFEALDKIKFDDIINYRPYAELTAYWDKRKAVQ